MYNFVDLNEAPQTLALPSVAMLFNGDYIENKVNGYRTLKVAGREMRKRVIRTADKSDGTPLFVGAYNDSLELTVTYELNAVSPKEFQQRYDELRYVLNTTNEVPIKFRDEPEWEYKGIVSGTSDVTDETNHSVSTFKIWCSESEKLGAIVSTSGAVTINTRYETVPETIAVVTSATVNQLKITNGRQTITLNGVINSGWTVVIDIKNQNVTVNGSQHLDYLALQSDFENFDVKKGETVTTTNGSLTLKLREVVA